MRSCRRGRSRENGGADARIAPGDQRGHGASEREADDTEALGHIGMCLEHADRAGGVGETGCERHPGRPMIAIREAERGDADARERLAGRYDMRLVRIAAEAVQDRGAADGARIRQVQDSIELDVADANPDPLSPAGHSSEAAGALAGSSGTARSSNTFRRSAIGVRELMSSSTFLRPFILPTRIAPTSLSCRKKSRL